MTAETTTLVDPGLILNYMALDKQTMEEIRFSSYLVAYKLLTGNWEWSKLNEQLLVGTVKRNLRSAQPE